MPNERLRAALLEHGITPAVIGGELGVDHKTVERWLAGRLPYRKYRYALAARLGLDEVYLWPDALPREVVGAASEAEILAVYPHRWQAPADAWRRLFTAAEREIGILVYAGMFLAEDAGAKKILADKARAGVRVRVLLGDPGSPQVAERGADEGIDEAGSCAALRARSSGSTRRSCTTRSTAATTSSWSTPMSMASKRPAPRSGTCARSRAVSSRPSTSKASNGSGTPPCRSRRISDHGTQARFPR